jgi:tetratricopeptide (TPR) repeat protein
MTVSDSAATGSVPAIWGNVPQRNKNFTGRTDVLAQLRPAAARKVTAVLQGGPLPQALQGLGGVGKTAVAIEYAYRYRSEYDLVWWIRADEHSLVRPALAALAGRLGLEAASATGIENAANAVLDALRRGEPYSRWLVIFDNADQPEDLKDVIPDGPGDVLITSRNHRWQSVVDTLPVDVFTRAESTEFLNKRVLKGLTESDVDRIADMLGGLPLALEQAGALLAETGMPVDEYLRLLEDKVTEILAEGKSVDYPESMTAAWMLQVAALREQLPQALELLRCCAFFGPDPIPRDAFRRGTQAAETQVRELIANPILLARAIRELGRFALVKIDGRTISVHRLVQALLRDELDPAEQAKYRHEVHLILASAAPASPADSSLWPRYSEMIAHVASRSTQLAPCTDPAVRTFALDVVRYLYLSGDLASCRSFAERFIAQWTEDSGPDDPTVLDARRHLGNALRQLGQYSEAYGVIEAALTGARKVLGEREPLTLALRNSFGADLRARGDFAAARQLDEETRDLHVEVFGAADPQTLRVMNNLATDYGLNSDYPAARELHQSVYLLQNESHTDVAATEVLTSWNGLAWAVRLCGSYTEARDVGEDARDFGRDSIGPEHYVTLRATNGLSIALRRIGTGHEEALEIAREVFDLYGRLFGEGNPDTMAAAISLTNIQRTIGQTNEALALAERTVNRYPDVYGPRHPYNYGCTGNLALLRRVTGDATGALQLNETALAGLDAVLTRDHHYSLTVATNLASDFAALGHTGKARALGEDTLPRLRRILGENHPLTLGCAANLVVDLRAEGSVEDAEQLLADTMNRYASTLGTDHPDATTAAAGQRLDFDFDPPPI